MKTINSYFCIVKIFLFIITLSIFLKPLFPVVDYVVNYDYITKTLCENKMKPAQECNGKCYLMKELAAASEDGKPTSSDKKTITTHELDILFCDNVQKTSFLQIFFHYKTSIRDNYANLYFHSACVSVFHPPKEIS